MPKENKYEVAYVSNGIFVKEIIFSTMSAPEIQRLWRQKVGSSNFRYVNKK